MPLQAGAQPDSESGVPPLPQHEGRVHPGATSASASGGASGTHTGAGGDASATGSGAGDAPGFAGVFRLFPPSQEAEVERIWQCGHREGTQWVVHQRLRL